MTGKIYLNQMVVESIYRDAEGRFLIISNSSMDGEVNYTIYTEDYEEVDGGIMEPTVEDPIITVGQLLKFAEFDAVEQILDEDEIEDIQDACTGYYY